MVCSTSSPANTRIWPDVVSILAHGLRRWTNYETKLGQALVFAGILCEKQKTLSHSLVACGVICLINLPPTELAPLRTMSVVLDFVNTARPRWWPNVTPTLNPQCDHRLSESSIPIKHETLTQCMGNVGPPSTTLAQHHLNLIVAGWPQLSGGDGQ